MYSVPDHPHLEETSVKPALYALAIAALIILLAVI